MGQQTFERAVDCPVSARATFDWHVRPGALRRLLPPWDNARVVEGSGAAEPLEKGARTVLRVGVGPVGIDWVAEISDLQAEKTFFVDRQVSGPFASWIHRHEVASRGKSASTLTDRIAYQLPVGPLGAIFGGRMVRTKLERMFAWRHRILLHDLEAHARAAEAGFVERTIAITGASGLVGRSLAAFLRTGGHRVLELVRREPRHAYEVRWDPALGTVDTDGLDGIDAIVHLAGESIFGSRWNAAKKARVVDSRVRGTRALVGAIGRLRRPPRTVVFASAIGYYGDRGEEELSEDAPLGTGFLAETCEAWEAEAKRLPDGVRGTRMRLGVVLDPGGGALRTMLPAFRAGVGGPLGGGRQWFPWIALDDVLGAFHRALYDDDLAGPVNLVAPGEVRNAAFVKTLAGVLRRPGVLPAPRFALRAALGRQQADEMLLASTRVRPTALERAGFPFRYPVLEDALEHALGLRR
ncbi:MAG: TIGR01777 family oxidoreductase [Planctomycetota bacterium]